MPKLWKTAISEHKREVSVAILDAAEDLLSKHGIHSVTMSQIAQSAGIGRATLYKYFPDLEAILNAWHERHISGCLDHLEEYQRSADPLRKRLEAVLRHYAMVQHRTQAIELSMLLHKQDYVVRAQQKLFDLIAALLTQAIDGGEIRNDVNPDEATTYCLFSLAAASNLKSEAAVERLVSLTLFALYKDKAPLRP